MGLLSFLGLGKKASLPIKAVGDLLDGLFTSDEERLDKKLLLERLRQKPHLEQIEINKVEAGHASIFVAGWRPCVGWICAFALGWHFLFYDIVNWIMISFYPEHPAPPALNGTETLITVLLSLLGLGGLRTLEKFGGVQKQH